MVTSHKVMSPENTLVTQSFKPYLSSQSNQMDNQTWFLAMFPVLLSHVIQFFYHNENHQNDMTVLKALKVVNQLIKQPLLTLRNLQ